MTWTQAVNAVAERTRTQNYTPGQLWDLLGHLPTRANRSSDESAVWAGLSTVLREALAPAYAAMTCDELTTQAALQLKADGTTYRSERHSERSHAITAELDRRHDAIADAIVDTWPAAEANGTRWVDHERAAYMAATPCEKHA